MCTLEVGHEPFQVSPTLKGKLTLGKMNCSTGLYQTPFTMVPGAGALNRAVTTGSYTQKQSVRESKVTVDQDRAAVTSWSSWRSFTVTLL